MERLVLALLSTALAGTPIALVFESNGYVADLATHVGEKVALRHCSSFKCGELHSSARSEVVAVVGMPRNISILQQLPGLKLLQSSHYMYARLGSVPAQATVAKYDVAWHQYGVEPIAEFVIAAAFQWTYRLPSTSRRFTSCAFGTGAPSECPSDSSLTAHPTLMNKTMGVLGYGNIGQAVAKRASGLGMKILATRRHGPFSSWLINDNDKLLAESDFVVVTVPGSVRGLINRTSLALMKKDAVLIPVSANPVDFDALYEALLTGSMGAVLDVWPQGCWHFPDMFCGPPYTEQAQPYSDDIANLQNVLLLPGVAMRDDRFWSNSAKYVGENLVALVNGAPLKGVVRNASTNALRPTKLSFV